MTSTQAYALLKKLKIDCFRTADAAALFHQNSDTASKLLTGLVQSGLLVKIKRGLWTFPQIDPLRISGFLTAPFQSYISLQSALYIHGIISQIPEVIYLASLARSQRICTSLGTFSIHHIQPDFFFGFEARGEGILLASPEKALMDLLYLSPARSRLFAALPELELPADFDFKKAGQMIKRVASEKRRKIVQRKFEKIRQNFTRETQSK